MHDRKQTAYHEAGHRVAELHFGFYPGKLTIEPNEEAAGSSMAEGGWMDGGEMDRAFVVALYAGFAAEQRLNPEADCGYSWNDDEKAADCLRFIGATDAELRQEARDLIADHWPKVEALATALLENAALSGDEADIIVTWVDEGLDWREGLAEFRARWGHFSEGESRSEGRDEAP